YIQSAGFDEMSLEEYEDLPDSIKALLPADPFDDFDLKNPPSKTFSRIRISQGYDNRQTAQNYGGTENINWSYHGQINWMGNTYGEGFINADGKSVDADGNLVEDPQYGGFNTSFYANAAGVALPNCAIWFKPAQVGKFRFVMYADTSGQGFSLLKATRTNATEEEPFKVDWSLNGQDIKLEAIIKAQMPANAFIYYDHDVTQEELDAGNIEYMLMLNSEAGTAGGAYFLYLDIGSSAAEDISGIVDDKAVSAVDFIYDGVTISEEENEEAGIKIGDFIVNSSGTASLYEASKTSVYFEEAKSILKMVYLRLHGRDDKKTVDISSSQPLPSKTGDAKATVPAYVIPDVGGGSGGVTLSSIVASPL
ncbi:MAG: hypothetical protein K2L72_05765, partial [Clostridia bacterium]|nr:hypothetical protein [Clostridia bacterium]